ncbi:cupin domain-containing protein [Methylorubrum extorquens]|uniref:cupin domain-containing protein n=1 Tax=Methylorubrum extorquens TaxID=408 RepID=UPI001EE5758F|nr:cupin domain-containing protein [Methylorubrum extorquens]MCG5248419.1 cupin domain-containing protein [Methylorubrum extorquens]
MDPRLNLIDQDKVVTFDEAAAAGFDDRVTAPWNQIFKIVFFPDRIYHARYLNATRSPRYQYNVLEVRGRADFIVMKTEVYLDGNFLCNALRIEYRAGRLAEQAREKGRLLGDEVLAWLELSHAASGVGQGLRRYVKLFYDSYVSAYQAEIWETLEPPPSVSHSFKVLDQMGLHKPITAVPGFRPALRNIRGLSAVRLSFREPERDRPLGYWINDPGMDNDYARSHQESENPRPEPNSPANTVDDRNYSVEFQRGWIKDAKTISPVLYQNAMMEPSSADYFRATQLPKPGVLDGSQNVMGMRWIIQRELGGTIVYFHEVELPPGAVEGTHQHVGSEELYYFTEGKGIAYLGDGDDPDVDAKYPLVEPTPDIYGLGPKPCRAIPVEPGITLFTKSGGIHGVRNPKESAGALKFVAFGYHSS